ncbi:MAG: hypothetical protein H8D56_08075 [Planctomycetes bacterium]|nr:hypothetical protein [Planctomycetota bacterium]MBL7146026.1 hypothetical protein [Phycisphaerae bacterium]
MSKILRNILIIVCIISCVSIAAGPIVKPNVRDQARKAELIDDPYKNSTILVEAFVVEVRLSALYDLGVSPIGEKPNSVSIDNILRCLQDEDNARIISGAKVASQQRERGTTESEQMIYLEQQKPAKTSEESKKPAVVRSPRPYKFNKSFRASANILAHNRIYVSFSFTGNSMDKVPAKDGMPPDAVNWQWSGTVCLERGKASIVGATQDEEKVVFLILCADIRDS